MASPLELVVGEFDGDLRGDRLCAADADADAASVSRALSLAEPLAAFDRDGLGLTDDSVDEDLDAGAERESAADAEALTLA